MTRLQPAIPLVDILEDDWDRQLFRGSKALAVQLGWLSFHVLRSRGSRAGYPDRTLVRDRIVFAELKREKTGPTDDQVEWLDKLAAAGGEVYLWRPSDLDEVSKVLASRGPFDAPSGSLKSGGVWWQPGSLWIAAAGRADTAAGRQESLLA